MTDEEAAALVADWPPLSEEKLRRIAALLQGAGVDQKGDAA